MTVASNETSSNRSTAGDPREPELLTAARIYLQAGLCLLPASVATKRPTLPEWKPFQSEIPSVADIDHWFKGAKAICIIAGAVSGNLEIIDFDCGADLYPKWCELVRERCPGLLERLVLNARNQATYMLSIVRSFQSRATRSWRKGRSRSTGPTKSRCMARN